MINQPVYRQEIHQHPDNHNDRYEMGNIRNGLYRPLKYAMSYLIQH